MTDIHGFVEMAYGANMHVKRIRSLGNAASSVIESGSLAIHAIGAGLLQANDFGKPNATRSLLFTECLFIIYKRDHRHQLLRTCFYSLFVDGPATDLYSILIHLFHL